MAADLRIGILWRGDRSARPSAPDPGRGLAPLYEAFEHHSIAPRAVVFEDTAVDEVRDELLGLDGVLVWVNPIQDGANRRNLDLLLTEAVAQGVWVSANPSVIVKLGTKEVLFTTRSIGWGVDTDLYRTPEELTQRFPQWLGDRGRLVVKQGRGNGGNGVWRVDLTEAHAPPGPDAIVRVFDARARDGSYETTTLGAFMTACAEYFAWSGCLVAQPFQERLADGMIRCYLSRDQVVGFGHQWPQGLLDADDLRPSAVRSAMVGPADPPYQRLRDRMQTEWIPRMQEVLALDRDALPVIWDADFLYGPQTAAGEDTYVLCEVNVSAVWPFPPMAADTVAAAALVQTRDAKRRRQAATRDNAGATMPLDSI